jgi:6-pyruvoyl-tetrahydropterin synthase related domain
VIESYSQHKGFGVTKWNLRFPGLSFWLPLMAIAFVGIYISLPMLQNSYPMAHSTQFNLSWVFQYQRQFFSGQFYPKWLEFSNFGFGNATFVFYPPICMVATLLFRAIGFDMPGSLVASMVLASMMLGWGFYLYARSFFAGWLALLIAELGMISPYFLLDIYHRGALGEVWAIAFIPWILFATQRVIDSKGELDGIWLLAIAYGMLVLSHLPTLLLFTLTWWLKPLMAGKTWEEKRENLRRSGLGFVLGLGWTGFFILPVLIDQRLIQLQALTDSIEYRAEGRLMLDGILKLAPKLPTHWFETGSGLIVFWWSTVAIVAIAALVYGVSNWQKNATEVLTNKESVPVKFWLIASLIAILMMTDISAWIYRLVPFMSRIQFSWRWFHILVFLLPLLLGYLIDRFSKQANKIPLILVAIACLFGLWQSQDVLNRAYFDPGLVNRFRDLSEQKTFPFEPNTDTEREAIFHGWHWIYPEGLALGEVTEYRAKRVNLQLPPEHRNYPVVLLDQGDSTKIQIPHWQFGYRQIFVDSPNGDQPYKLELRTFYYPGWHIEIDGKTETTQANESGQIVIYLEPGKHEITVAYWGTWAEWLGYGVTGLVILGIIIYWWQDAKQYRRLKIGEY